MAAYIFLWYWQKDSGHRSFRLRQHMRIFMQSNKIDGNPRVHSKNEVAVQAVKQRLVQLRFRVLQEGDSLTYKDHSLLRFIP